MEYLIFSLLTRGKGCSKVTRNMGHDTTAMKQSADDELRRRAETRIDDTITETGLIQHNLETQRLLHELEVHRIELEIQNEELRQARDEAERNLVKYSDLYDFAPVGYFTLDRNGSVNSVNLRGATIVGVPRSQLLGHAFGLLVAQSHRPHFTTFLDDVFATRNKTTCEVTLREKDNRPFMVLLEAMAAESGDECGLVLINITERKLLEGDLRSYASRLIMMEEELRNKISTELHDDICQDLTVLGMNMVIIGDGMKEGAPKKLTARFKVSEKLVKEISHTVRNIMVGLRPPVLDDFGLLAALRWHAALFSKRTNIAVIIEADDSFPRIMAKKETTLFRISQEALMNIAKHADAQNVTIKLSRVNGMIGFVVSDDGKGFIPTEITTLQDGSGWGLRIMRERAELIGGKFHLDSAPGTGTTVSVAISCEEL
jgi:PAS domain S-box-containing protein